MGYTRGRPDWAGSQARQYVGAGGSDLEISSRLWPPYSQVYLGEVFFADSFEAPVLHWAASTNNDDKGVELTTQYANTGNQSLYLYTANLDGDTVGVSRQYTVPTGNRIGGGAFFSNYGLAGTWELAVRCFRNGRDILFQARIDIDADTLEINSDGAWVQVGTAPGFGLGENVFTWWQLVVDADTATYVRVIVGANQIDLDQPAQWDHVYTDQDVIELSVIRRSAGVFVAGGWMDDVIMTRNEQ